MAAVGAVTTVVKKVLGSSKCANQNKSHETGFIYFSEAEKSLSFDPSHKKHNMSELVNPV